MKLFTLILLVFGFLSASAEEIVATVGPKKITLSEFNKKYADIKGQVMNPPTKQEFLEDLVRYEVGLLEAEKRQLNKDPIVLDRFNQEMYKALLEKELGEKVQKITVSEEEMKAWYKDHPEIRSSHILIELKSGATDEQRTEAKKRANELFSEVKKSKRPFEELVKLYSDDSLSKPSGGDVGWQTKVTLVPQYYEAVLKTKSGEVVNELIETPFGYHIVKVTGKHDFASANKRQIRAAVFDEKRRQLFNSYFDKIKKSYSIKINNSVIK